MSEIVRTFGALVVLAKAVRIPDCDPALLDRDIAERIGGDWNFASAVQWLTGSKARAVVDGLTDKGTFAGLHKEDMLTLLDLAQTACQAATGDAGDLLAKLRYPLDKTAA
ncbi:hypothetical protein ABWL39_19855 [Chitinivorax sp. PXF-14]|uniref:hypothetical protein n=1 Tax=Chitinivorax sp. PXF-14 TaxID=3230488 RepID=UPI0034657ED8